MIVYAEDGQPPEQWKPGQQLQCGCVLGEKQLRTFFGAHLNGQRSLVCVHSVRYVISAEVQHVVNFTIKEAR